MGQHPNKGPIKVDLGALQSTAISAILIDHHGDGTADLGITVLVPVSIPGATQPHYKAVTVALTITEAQRTQIMDALAGKQSKRTNDNEGTKGNGAEGEGAPSLAPDKQHPGGC